MRRILGFFSILSMLILLSGCATTTPLENAAKSGDITTVKDLLNKGADVNKILYGWSALLQAAWNGHTDIVKLLIDKGANVNASLDSYSYETVLQVMAEKGDTAMVKLLIDKGADVNAMGKYQSSTSALGFAAEKAHTDIVKILIEKGADIDRAIVSLEQRAAFYATPPAIPSAVADSKSGIKLLERIIKKQQIANQPQPSQGISKEDLKTIVQAAVEGAKTQKESKSPSVQSDIDKPSFAIAERIFGDNDVAVVIGIEGYQALPKSDFSYDDAKLVKEYIKALGFKERNIELITDEKATKSSIEKTLEAWLKNKTKPESRVFVYYSGHGSPDPKTGDAYIVPYDGDPNYLEVTGYPLKRLYEKLGKLQVAEITVVLDSCFSGAGGRSVLAKGARPLVMMTTSTVLPSNIAVLSATQGTQISTSSPEKGTGYSHTISSRH
jgi:hypothetical protein